jgi:hypothetical protein
LILPKVDSIAEHILPVSTGALKIHTSGRSASENCARARDLGFIASKRIRMYGEHFELVSDPFTEGDCTVVRAISKNDSTVRTLRLPVSILVGLLHPFRQKIELAGPEVLLESA